MDQHYLLTFLFVFCSCKNFFELCFEIYICFYSLWLSLLFFNWHLEFSFCLSFLLEENYNVVLVSAMQQWKSATIIHIPPSPLPTPPLWVITECRLGSLCYTAICFTHGSVYMSMLLSPLVPLSPSPTASTTVIF